MDIISLKGIAITIYKHFGNQLFIGLPQLFSPHMSSSNPMIIDNTRHRTKSLEWCGSRWFRQVVRNFQPYLIVIFAVFRLTTSNMIPKLLYFWLSFFSVVFFFFLDNIIPRLDQSNLSSFWMHVSPIQLVFFFF